MYLHLDHTLVLWNSKQKVFKAETSKWKFSNHPKAFEFCEILKFLKNIRKFANYFCYCFLLHREKMLTQIEPQLKVKIEDGREAPQKPCLFYLIQVWEPSALPRLQKRYSSCLPAHERCKETKCSLINSTYYTQNQAKNISIGLPSSPIKIEANRTNKQADKQRLQLDIYIFRSLIDVIVKVLSCVGPPVSELYPVWVPLYLNYILCGSPCI